MLENKTKMYGVIINLAIKDKRHTIIHATTTPFLSVDLFTDIVIAYLSINHLRYTFNDFENATVTVYNGAKDITFDYHTEGVFPILLKEIK